MANRNAKGAGLGLGLAALAAAAAGAYYFYGKDGAKRRQNLKGWMVKAKGEVMDKLENLSEISQETYQEAISDVLDKYKKLKKASPAELAAFAKELKGHWGAIKGDLDKATKKSKPRSKSK